MTANGMAQIVLYVVILARLPLGVAGARVRGHVQEGFVNGRLAEGRAPVPAGGRIQPRPRAELEELRRIMVVFSIVFTVLLYLLLRWQAHLPLNPDHLPDVTAPIALNTTASFITNTNWQYYGGSCTVSYLSQIASLAVQNFVLTAVGMAVGRHNARVCPPHDL